MLSRPFPERSHELYPAGAVRSHPRCLVVADDLTGACDTGVHFAREGFPTWVSFGGHPGLESPDSIPVLNTQTRSQAVAEAIRRVEQAIGSAPPDGVLYKKIDSTLYGHVAEELAAALRAGSRKSAVFTPAYPAMGRTVRDGILYVSGIARHEISRILGTSLRLVPTIEIALAEPGTVFVADAESQDELRRVAGSTLPFRNRLLLVGSGGLARELAPLLAAEIDITAAPMPELLPRTGPVVFFIGSHNPVTLRQARRLQASRLNCRITTIRLSEGRRPADTWRRTVESARAILFCGGESAQLVCGTLGGTGMSLRSEIVPGVPWGILQGGSCGGIPAATKAGGFGNENSLIDVARFFLQE